MSFAQTINGQITDIQTAEGLIGATVVVKGTATGTITDFDGNFVLKVSDAEGILVISYVGYESLEQSFTIPEGATSTTLDIDFKSRDASWYD